jgi:hypothetical protein
LSVELEVSSKHENKRRKEREGRNGHGKRALHLNNTTLQRDLNLLPPLIVAVRRTRTAALYVVGLGKGIVSAFGVKKELDPGGIRGQKKSLTREGFGVKKRA